MGLRDQLFSMSLPMVLKPARFAPARRRAVGTALTGLRQSGAKVALLGAGMASWAARSSAAMASAVVRALTGASVLPACLASGEAPPALGAWNWKESPGKTAAVLGAEALMAELFYAAGLIAIAAGSAPSLPKSWRKTSLRLNTMTAATSGADYRWRSATSAASLRSVQHKRGPLR